MDEHARATVSGYPSQGMDRVGERYQLQFGDYEKEECSQIRKVIPTEKGSSDPGCGTQILPLTLEEIFRGFHHVSQVPPPQMHTCLCDLISPSRVPQTQKHLDSLPPDARMSRVPERKQPRSEHAVQPSRRPYLGNPRDLVYR